MEIKHILFDLDETLYPPDTGLWPVLGDRMNTYIHTRLGIPIEEVEELREHYFFTYGTSLRGLQVDYGVDANEYLDFVHEVDIPKYIKFDQKLNELLESIPLDKVIFTNANKAHTLRVLSALGIEKHFSLLIDVVDMDPFCKPNPQAFETAMKLVGDPNPEHYLLLDDSIKNVQTAMTLGMSAIHVSPHRSNHKEVLHVTRVHDLKKCISKFDKRINY